MKTAVKVYSFSYNLSFGCQLVGLFWTVVLSATFSSGIVMGLQAGTERGPTNKDGVPLTIAGLQLLEPGKKSLGHVKDKHANETSATALGYVGHVSSFCAELILCYWCMAVYIGGKHSKTPNLTVPVCELGCHAGSKVLGCATAVSNS